MARRIHTSEQIIHKLREAEVLLAQGQSVQQAARQIEVTEQESIEGTIKKRAFYRKNIDSIYENNFKNKIPINEYESIIFDICIAKTLIMGDTDENKIRKKIEDTVMTFNIRSKDLIAEKVSMAVANDPRTKGRVKALVDSKYKDIVSPLVSDMIKELIPNQEIDSRKIISTVQKERFELDTVSISKLFTKELKAFQAQHGSKVKSDLAMRRMGKGNDIKRDSRAPGAKTAVEKMSIVVSREKKRKEDFINSIGDIAFKLSETYLDNVTRVFVHTADYKTKRIVIISYAVEGEIDNVSILFESAQGQQGGEFFFDLGELQSLDDKVTPTFLKSKLGLFSKGLGVPGVLEVIWFLSNVLDAERKLPFKTVEFIEETLLVHLESIETGIYKATVQEAIQGGT